MLVVLIGKHSELLAITPDPLAYAQEQVLKFNQEYKEGKVEMSFIVDFNEKLTATTDTASKSALIYCADAGLGSLNIRKYNSTGGRAFIVTQSIKKLSNKLKKAVFNDYDYRRLSNDAPIAVKYMQEFDRFEKDHLPLYNDLIYRYWMRTALWLSGCTRKKSLKMENLKWSNPKQFLNRRLL